MNERDLVATQAVSRLRVDHVGAGVGELARCRGHVWYLEGHMVHSRATLGQEAADRAVLPESRDELDPPAAHAEVDGLDALVLHAASELDPRAEQPLVRRNCLVEILDRHRDVMHGPHLHGP